MKYFLFLLFTTVCFAQNMKVMAFRLVNENDDGPCSVKTYVDNPLISYQTYVTAESNDPIFAQNLLKLKKEARKWKKSDYFCFPGAIGGSMIHNMFVVSYNGVNDTILSTLYNDMIIFPGEEKAYSDKKGTLKKILPENLTDFFKHDFKSQIRSLSFPEKNDSITIDKILYNGKPGNDRFNKDFGKNPGNFIKIHELPGDNYNMEIYTFKNDTIQQYGKEINVSLTNTDSGWNIDGIKVGDTEEKFRIKYPTSARIQKYYNIRYEDILHKYCYWVLIRDNKGSITYFIKDGVIEKIEIHYR